MMLIEKYRSSTEYREILRIIQKATTLQENFLWQSHALEKNIVPILHIEIDFVARELVITIDAERYRLDLEIPLYVKLDYRQSVFKVMKFRQTQNIVNFAFPELIKTPELRQYPRLVFKPAQEKFVTLKSSMSSQFHRETGTELNVRVMDVSEFGLGLIVSEQNRSFLKNNRILWVTALEGIHLQYPVLAEVIYINNEVDPKFQTRRQKELKVGLKLSGTFPAEAYRRFLL